MRKSLSKYLLFAVCSASSSSKEEAAREGVSLVAIYRVKGVSSVIDERMSLDCTSRVPVIALSNLVTVKEREDKGNVR